MPHPVTIGAVLLGALAGAASAADPVVITFEKAETGKPVPTYTDKDHGVEFALARPPVPSFELTVKAPTIASVRFSGAPPGGYLVCDEVRFTPRTAPGK